LHEKKREKRMKKGILLLIVCSLVFGKLNAQNWDINTVKKVNGWEMHNLSKAFSHSGPILSVGIPTVMGVYALIQKDEPLLKDAIYIGTTVVEAVGITYGLKYTFDRRRPYVKYPQLVHPIEPEDSPSFPSGHTAAAFSLATSLSITYPKWYVIAPSALWACGVGFARMNQGVHYPSDVLTGAAIGVGCAFVNVYVNRWLNKVLFKD
jgi:membrane-associated phospholipid phosphatase